MTKTVVGMTGWLGIVACGFVLFAKYERTPGPVGAAGATLSPSAQVATALKLTMFVHPKCPCSRASVEQLAEVLKGVSDRHDLACEVWFYRPADEADEWAHSDLWERAAHLPGVRVFTDPAGAEAARCGAVTSGHTILSDSSGQVLFTGGITGGRGVRGENAGGAMLSSILAGAKGQAVSPVFGCGLIDGDVSPETARGTHGR